MNGRFLLDTNIAIACLSGETDVIDRINDADEFFVVRAGAEGDDCRAC